VEREWSETVDGIIWTGQVRHQDQRGWFIEAFRASQGHKNIAQVNVSFSRPNVLRGMHWHKHQTDHWMVGTGSALVAVFDPVVGVHETRTLIPGQGVIIPQFVAHGFYTLSELALVYGVTKEYDPDNPDEHGYHPYSCGINWPAMEADVIMSKRDRGADRWR
jgi:dTDP-4-dehydrorhamnose 3,5-epimerase